MGLKVNTNVAALQGQRALRTVSRETEDSFAKLSSGQRINKAADDAAGLAISEKIKAEVRSSRQANRNANDGISMIQTAEGGLNETSAILTRMRELAIQAATDTLTDTDRGHLGMEYQGLKMELERIARNTEFNGRKLLDGTGSELTFQVGVGADSADDHIAFRPGAVNARVDALGITHANVHSKYQAQESLGKLDRAIDKVSQSRSILGSIQQRLLTSSNNLGIYTENMAQANSRIRDTDFAEETAKQARNSIIQQAGTAVQVQANTSGQNALKLV